MECAAKQCFKKDFLFDPNDLITCQTGGDGQFKTGAGGVTHIWTTKDGKVDILTFEDGKTLTYVKSKMGYPALYPFVPARIEKPVKAVLMDLDGTSVRSEAFWIWIIEQTTARLLNNPKFELCHEDMPFVSGHSVSEHLKYCTHKYCPNKTVEEARVHYFDITHEQMRLIMEGKGKKNAFQPTEGLKDFLLTLKSKGIKLGLVTSGLYEKAWPEILDAFRQLDMGDPADFYDAIITAGYAIRKGQPGTLGELEPKPHPWLYAETARVGLGLDFADRHSVVGIEDSGAGVLSIRLAGFACLGLADGNIIQSGTKAFCSHYCDTLHDMLPVII